MHEEGLRLIYLKGFSTRQSGGQLRFRKLLARWLPCTCWAPLRFLGVDLDLDPFVCSLWSPSQKARLSLRAMSSAPHFLDKVEKFSDSHPPLPTCSVSSSAASISKRCLHAARGSSSAACDTWSLESVALSRCGVTRRRRVFGKWLNWSM